MKEAIYTTDAPEAVGPYSQAVRAGNTIFCSGQIGLTRAGMLAGDAIEAQTEQVLENLKAVLVAAGASLEDVVKTTVYLEDLGDFAAMNAVYAGYFTGVNPARATVEVKALPKGAKIEIDAIAVV